MMLYYDKKDRARAMREECRQMLYGFIAMVIPLVIGTLIIIWQFLI